MTFFEFIFLYLLIGVVFVIVWSRVMDNIDPRREDEE